MVDVPWIGLCPEKCEKSKQPKQCDKQPSNSSNSRIQSRIGSGFFCGYSVGDFDAISTKHPCQPHSQNSQRNCDISPGWWYTYPSEKYDFVSWGYYSILFSIYGKITNVPNHQPVTILMSENHETYWKSACMTVNVIVF
jgi:hypothetical protein